MKLLDRYVLRSFLEPFLITFFAFTAIWLIIDLSDNAADFLEAHASAGQIARFYLTQLPPTVLLSLPVALLLALLYALSRMSRTNELISMLAAGRSVSRLLVPLAVVGLVVSGICLWLNWELAPAASGIKKNALKQMKRGRKPTEVEALDGHLFRDRQNQRTWFVKRFKPGELKLDGVHITQQAADGRITRKWYATRALYVPASRSWLLRNGMIVDFTETGDIASTDHFPGESRTITDWTETPWRIASSEIDPQSLSVPQLRAYLTSNADFPAVQLAPYRTNLADRFALPLSCLAIVLVAAPLGIVFNRRGVLSSVAWAIFVFFAMIMLRYLFVAFGKGARVDPWLAPWVPDILFGILGLILLWFRSANHDLRTLFRARA